MHVPRDRAWSFEAVAVPKHARRLTGFDEAVISLYVKGMTAGDIADHLQEVYGWVRSDLAAIVDDQDGVAHQPALPGHAPVLSTRARCGGWVPGRAAPRTPGA
jgi:hypothetical protein